MPSIRNIAILIAAAVSLGGCVFGRTKYDCPAPNGVSCMSAREIYDATQTTDTVTKKPDAAAGRSSIRTESRPIASKTQGIDFSDNEMTLAGEPARAVANVIPDNLPVRLPAKILRVWVAGWEDDAGTLHAPSLLYAEIAPRRWTIGEPAPQLAPTLELVQPLQPVTQTNAPTPRTERDVNPNQDGTLDHSN